MRVAYYDGILRAWADLVVVLRQNVLEGFEVEGIAVGERSIHIEEHAFDGAEVWHRAVLRGCCHCDACNLDCLCANI